MNSLNFIIVFCFVLFNINNDKYLVERVDIDFSIIIMMMMMEQ
jgi:hypothetical protein